MSRIGKKPITIPAKVEVKVGSGNLVEIKGPKGTLVQAVDLDIKVSVEGSNLNVERPTDQKRHKALHGLYRSLLNNMVLGVSEGYKIDLELVGVGYKATSTGSVLELSLGYSHNIFVALPNEVAVKTSSGRMIE